MTFCLVVQPIHSDGLAALEAAGLEARVASTPSPLAVEREIRDAVAVITRNAGLSGIAMDTAADLQVIGVHGVGVDPVDLSRASELGIPVLATPGTNAVSVAEQAVALMLATGKRVVEADAAARAGDFDFKHRVATCEFAGKTLGVVGWGRIGRCMARICRAGLAMRVLAYSPSADAAAVAQDGAELRRDLRAFLADCDVVSMHVPLRDDTRGLLGVEELAALKPGAILVNTGRGATVDQPALVEALRSGRLAGAGLDVFASEDLTAEHPLSSLDNVVLSPHIGGSSEEALRRTARAVAEGVIGVLRGERPHCLVNPAVWDRRRRPAGERAVS